MIGLKVGDIVLIRSLYSSHTRIRHGLIINCYKNEVLVADTTKEIEKYRDEDFTEIIEISDINEGVIDKPLIAILNRINHFDSSICEKTASLRREKIDTILRKLSKLFPQVY